MKMIVMRAFVAFLIFLGLASCAEPRFLTYSGPEVTSIIVKKSERRMYLLNGSEVLKSYRIDLGNNPVGHKSQQGDGRTPEGLYYIDRRNPNSQFHLSVGISYPNTRDRAMARARGVSPGGDIFIHGTPPKYARMGKDWTWGCIAVTNREIEEIYAMVQNRTPVLIQP